MSHESTSPNPIYIPLSIDDGPSFIHPVIHSLICMSQVMCEYLMRNHVDEKESFHSAARLMHRQAVARFVARLQQQHSYSTGQFSELIYLRHRLICNECVRNWKASQFFAPLVLPFSVCNGQFCVLSSERIFSRSNSSAPDSNQLEQSVSQSDGWPDRQIYLDKMIASNTCKSKLFHYPNHSTLKFNNLLRLSSLRGCTSQCIANRSQLNSK